MNKLFSTYVVITIQLAALLALQLNMVAPQVARLFPALAVGDLSECHCTIECRCSLENRKKGICCCKQAKRLKLKMHCNAVASKSKVFSLRSCPCGESSHITFVSPENQVYIGFFETPPTFAYHPGTCLVAHEPQPLYGRTPEPPDPPPRLSFLS